MSKITILRGDFISLFLETWNHFYVVILLACFLKREITILRSDFIGLFLKT